MKARGGARHRRQKDNVRWLNKGKERIAKNKTPLCCEKLPRGMSAAVSASVGRALLFLSSRASPRLWSGNTTLRYGTRHPLTFSGNEPETPSVRPWVPNEELEVADSARTYQKCAACVILRKKGGSEHSCCLPLRILYSQLREKYFLMDEVHSKSGKSLGSCLCEHPSGDT